MRRSILALLLALAMGGTAFARGVTAETWRGTGVQITREGAEESWSIRIDFFSDNTVTVAYASLGCGGTLTLIAEREGRREYRERLTSGQDACEDGGIVILTERAGRMFYAWTGEGTKEPEGTAVGVLWRDPDAEP